VHNTDRDEWSNVVARITVSGDRDDIRYKEHPFSEIFAVYRIAHCGVLTTDDPYELTRIHQNGSCMVATIQGEGRVFVDGDWVAIPEGHACLLPPFAFNSIRSMAGQQWTFAWAKYLEDEGSHPIVTAMSPVSGRFDPRSMECAIKGLHHNLTTSQDRGMENLWVELIHRHVTIFASPKIEDERLWSLWTEVQKSLSSAWSIEELATRANLSPEHLRRLCKKQFGRSPKQQLTHLRMRKARLLLANTENKVEAVALEVGYPDVASFSNAFKKFMGFRPSEMR